ncbi:MAG: hypothetical protein WCJ31_07295 [Planctomycetia bacterium]
MAKKKAAKVSRPAAAKTPQRTLKKKPQAASPTLSNTSPTPVVFQKGQGTRFMVNGYNLLNTVQIPPGTTDSTLKLSTNFGVPVYTFPEGSVSVSDGGTQSFTVVATWTGLKKSGFAGSGKLLITIMTGNPKTKISGSFPATIK